MRWIMIALLTAGSLAACQKNNVTDSYQYSENECDTGKHEFSGSSADDVKNQICTALKDESVNNGCAYDLRKADFENRCGGQSW